MVHLSTMIIGTAFGKHGAIDDNVKTARKKKKNGVVCITLVNDGLASTDVLEFDETSQFFS
jgi:hypothetical protein